MATLNIRKNQFQNKEYEQENIADIIIYKLVHSYLESKDLKKELMNLGDEK